MRLVVLRGLTSRHTNPLSLVTAQGAAERRVGVLEAQAKKDGEEMVEQLAQLADTVAAKAAVERKLSELEQRVQSKDDDEKSLHVKWQTAADLAAAHERRLTEVLAQLKKVQAEAADLREQLDSVSASDDSSAKRIAALERELQRATTDGDAAVARLHEVTEDAAAARARATAQVRV